MIPHEACRTCRCFEVKPPIVNGQKYEGGGFCRRYPPGVRGERIEVRDRDWCGEWRPRVEDQAPVPGIGTIGFPIPDDEPWKGGWARPATY
jgi:hypothetical protein